MVIEILPTTGCAPAERAEGHELQLMVQHFLDNAKRFAVLDNVPDAVLILNRYRQVVYANRALAEIHGLEDVAIAYGRRPGELLACEHAANCSGGCGTSETCAQCGALQAILAGLDGEATVKECRITRQESGEALDMRVHASPYEITDDTFCLLVIKDIAHEKRRRVLERIFFHDILNTAGGLQGYAELLTDCSYDELDEMGFRDTLPRVARQIVDEITAQRLLLQAENGEIELCHEPIEPRQLLDEVAEIYARHEVAENRRLVVQARESNGRFVSDRTLLARVVGNMVKNALEACVEGQTVTLTAEIGDTWVEFAVHNPTVMPKDVQLQLFKRSFSTKGADRGLGTYSLRLIGEKYLGGKVAFSSAESEGTTFRILLPLEP